MTDTIQQASGSCPACGNNDSKRWLKGPDRFHGRATVYQLLRCSSCSLVWLDDPPRPDEMAAHYGADYDRVIQAAGESSPDKWEERRKTIAHYKSGGALLDLGCSSGSFLASLDRGSWNGYGIEMSSDCAKRAEATSGARVFVGDILEAPFPTESFDVITCFDVLEHVYEPRKVLEKVRQWLKPNGIFYVLVPNIEAAEARFFRSYWYALELPRHLSHFSPKSLRYLAKLSGLEEVSVATHRNSAFARSLHYIVMDNLLPRIGIVHIPLAKAGPASIPWKIISKILRLTSHPFFTAIGAFAGGGESIHAVFKKGASLSGLARDEK
jgi:2-polyprenyl-3-methyl-5-hydroxy-6-metoxy-1,4-benzoquinol methylase